MVLKEIFFITLLILSAYGNETNETAPAAPPASDPTTAPVTEASTAPETTPVPAKPPGNSGGSIHSANHSSLMALIKALVNVYAVYFMVSYLSGVVAETPTSPIGKSKLIVKNEPTNMTLEERGLIVSNPKIRDIIRDHNAYTTTQLDIKKTNGTVLGYVTPWNGHGYKIAKIFAKKFTHICPVWLQLKMDAENFKTRIEGVHDVDFQWMKAVRAGNPDIKIVPRLIFDQWNQQELHALFEEQSMAGIIAKQLIASAEKYEFDGYVLEMWNAFAVQQRDQVIHLIAKIYAHFKKNGLQLMLVVPPPIHHGGRPGILTRHDVERLAPYVHGFSVMTYDYSSIQRPGPNSPIDWVRECIKLLAPKASSPIRKKLLMGLNMYGFDYTPTGGGPIIGSK